MSEAEKRNENRSKGKYIVDHDEYDKNKEMKASNKCERNKKMQDPSNYVVYDIMKDL